MKFHQRINKIKLLRILRVIYEVKKSLEIKRAEKQEIFSNYVKWHCDFNAVYIQGMLVTRHGPWNRRTISQIRTLQCFYVTHLQQVRRTSMFSGNGVTKLIISICYSPKFTNQKFLLIPNIFHEFFWSKFNFLTFHNTNNFSRFYLE